MKRILDDEFLKENIDEGMRYAIAVLNEKGYETNYCCEGHYNEKYECYVGAYISFKESIPKELFPKLPSFPWKDDDKAMSRYKTPITVIDGRRGKYIKDMTESDCFYWEFTKYKRTSRAAKDLEHDRFIVELNEWVDMLPVRE
ncbi:MAG: hypothetical protein K6B67_02430 [Lachnospiraceae bacterium]|nr:hypothetical protein [Lachnospiraceae bacterium]